MQPMHGKGRGNVARAVDKVARGLTALARKCEPKIKAFEHAVDRLREEQAKDSKSRKGGVKKSARSAKGRKPYSKQRRKGNAGKR